MSSETGQPPATQERGPFSILRGDELERNGNWSLVRRSLGVSCFGANVVEIAAGESIPEHDEVDRDQEELFYFIAGAPLLVIDGTEHRVSPGTFARLDPEP